MDDILMCYVAVCRFCLIRHLTDVKECPTCRLAVDENRLSKEIRSADVVAKFRIAAAIIGSSGQKF